jgi:hypothetical protein
VDCGHEVGETQRGMIAIDALQKLDNVRIWYEPAIVQSLRDGEDGGIDAGVGKAIASATDRAKTDQLASRAFEPGAAARKVAPVPAGDDDDVGDAGDGADRLQDRRLGGPIPAEGDVKCKHVRLGAPCKMVDDRALQLLLGSALLLGRWRAMGPPRPR